MASSRPKSVNQPEPEDFFADIPVLDVHKRHVPIVPVVGADLDASVGPSKDFIRDYIRFADRFETPTAVHEAVAMSLVAMSANGKVVVDVGEIQIPLDFWIYIISGSGTGKNTITKPAREIVAGAGLNRLMHNESFGSAPQMEEYFSERPQGWIVNTEMGQFMAKFSQNQFQGALEWLANLYDELALPPDKNYRKKAKTEDETPAIIFEAAPRISFLGMSSRSWFLKYADRGKATGGFLPRWIPVIVDDTERSIPRVSKADASLVPPLVEKLKMISRLRGAMDVSAVVEIYDEVVFRFARESGDERRADGDARDAVADVLNQPPHRGAVALAAHGAQHPVADVLQRHVDVRADLLLAGDRIEQLVGDVTRVVVEQPDPAQPIDLHQLTQQAAQRRAVAPIAAVGGQILCDEVELDDAVVRQRRGFGKHRVERPALVTAADLRNDAEAAGVIAAFRHLEIGAEEVSGADAWDGEVGKEVGGAAVNGGVGAPSPSSSGKRVKSPVPRNASTSGSDSCSSPAVPLHQAAGDDEPLASDPLP